MSIVRPILLATIMALCGGVALGQFPRHSLTSIHPAGGQTGSTVLVEVGGLEIDPNVALTFDHPGLRAFRFTGAKFAVAIAPDVPPGHHDARLSGPLGLSAPRSFVVSREPMSVEVEPNDSIDGALAITLPALIQGRMNALADIDSFAFEAKAGDLVTAELATLGIDSRMDGAFRLIAPSGRVLIGPSDLRGPEPSFAARLPETGRYVLQVHDLVYAGSPDHAYRLAIRPGPRQVVPEINSASGTRIVAETEPNDGPTQAQSLPAPCEVAAAFNRPGDVDIYRFVATKGETWIIEVLAERIGTACDPEFLVRRLVAGGSPVDVLAGDDIADPFGGRRFPIGTLDPSARFEAPETGTYELTVHDRDGSPRAAESTLAYRLRIRPERPDFDLFIVPNDATNPEATTLRAGGRANAVVLVNRRDGLTGPIVVEPRDLPAGISCEPVIVAANAVTAPIVLSAEPGRIAWDGSIRFVGRNVSGDRKELLDHTPGRKVRPEVEHLAIAGVLVWPMPAAAGDTPPIARARTTSQFALAVRDGAPFRLTASPGFAVVGHGETLEITAEVARMNGFAAELNVATADLPAGLPAPAAAKIAKDKTTVTLALKVPKEVPPGLYSFVLRGAGPFPFSKDSAAKEKPNLNVDEPSNVVTIRVRP